MFGYFSHLIEQHEMAEVDVGFLVVGHTHYSFDQYFSTLSSAITKADFIPTPDAIRYLLTVAHHDSTQRPAAINVRALHVSFIYVVLCHDNSMLLSRNLLHRLFTTTRRGWSLICRPISNSSTSRIVSKLQGSLEKPVCNTSCSRVVQSTIFRCCRQLCGFPLMLLNQL